MPHPAPGTDGTAALNGTRLLRPETVALMGQNHTGSIPCGVLKTYDTALSNDVAGLITTQILPFADQRTPKLYGQFERSISDTLKPA